MVTVSEAYFDESYQDDEPRILCVAGYVFRKSHSSEFSKKWSAYLKRKGLPYFHANECAHKRGVFKGRTDTGEISRELIALAKLYSEFAVAVSVDRKLYESVCQGHNMFPTAYTFVLTNCLYQIANWRDYRRQTSATAFFFEQGHRHQSDAHKYLSFMLAEDIRLHDRIGYKDHAFVPKETPQVQPADLLAWLWRLHTVRKASGDQRPDRQDLIALHRPTDQFLTLDREALERFRDSLLTGTKAAEAMVRSMLPFSGLGFDEMHKIMMWQPDYRKMRF